MLDEMASAGGDHDVLQPACCNAANGEEDPAARPWRLGNMPAFYDVSVVDLAMTHTSPNFIIEFQQPKLSGASERDATSLTQAGF